jgi:hypothetical protein
MAEHGSVATGKHGGVTSPVVGKAGVTHCVDATMDSAEPVRLEGTRDVALGKSLLP